MFKQSLKLFKRAFINHKANYKYLTIVLGLEIISIILLYNLNSQYGSLYQGIQEYNKNLIWRSVEIFAGLAMILVGVGGYTTFFINKLAFGIREGLTDYYRDSVHQFSISNIEQRIQEDIRNFGRFSVDLWLSIFKATIKLPLFLTVIVGLTSWYVGTIILIAVIVGTLLTKWAAAKLILLQVSQESNEADFREALQLNNGIQDCWLKIKSLFNKINVQLKKLTFLQSGLGQTFVLLPFIILLPLYIAKTITMGAFFQSVNALSKVIDSLTILIDQRQLIADTTTCVKRMETLDGNRNT